MRRLLLTLALGSASIWMAACGAPANNAPANNSNTNSKPAAAAPTADTFMDMEKKANEAFAKGDTTYFDTLLSDKAVMSNGKDHMGKAAVIEMIKNSKCEMKGEIKLSEPQLAKINDDTYAFTYKNDTAGSCTENGKSMEMKPMRASTVYIRSGEKWQAVWHGEAEIMNAAAPADKKDDTAAETRKEEPKKEEKAAEPKKEEAKKAEEAKPAANTSANSAAAAPAKLTPSANTEALTKAHNMGWEAFKNKDAKFFETALTSSFAYVDPMGGYHGSKADAVANWTGTGAMKCEGITKASFTDGFAAALSPTAEILFGKGNADGTCDGQKNGDLWQTSVYIKEGDAWKLAFMFEQLPPKA